ncbi:MAG: DNRLRE domain-containing protein, partial [Candidatus Poseidoniaceae archaeon]|nr:DNRLRE domain-containing protein [Candidatus Poseidoniaceae archaeon]
MISNWSAGYFLLPSLDVIDNNDGTATISAYSDDLNLDGLKLIEDVTVDSSMPNMEYGSDALITVQSDSMSESITHTRINSQYLGLNSNMAILDADIEFQRVVSPTVNSMLSLHNNDAIGWAENDANWRFYTTLDEWNDGGIDSVGVASNTILMAGQASQRFPFSIEDVIQSSLDESSQSGLEFTLLSRLGDESFSTNNAISFGSTESTTLSSQPKLEITYMISQNSIVPSPELLTPVDGGPVWNLTGDNISANTLPSMTWNSSLSSPYGMLFQLSEDKYFRNLLFNNDSRVANPIQSSSGNFAIPYDMPLDTGKMYFWRMSNFDSDNRLSNWVYSSFLVSSLSSNWLGGDRYEMSLELGTESLEQFYPNCYESSISSTFTSFNNYGSSTIIVSDDQTQGIATSLLQCDVSNYLLPSGYAIESSQIELQLSSYSNPAEIGVWEGIEHNWTAKDVTWNNYAGAQGQLLDTQAITNSALQGDIVAWNVTSATQRSMRDGTPLDLIFNTITPSTSTSFYSSFEFDQSKRPSLKYVYIPGSNQLPDFPTLDLPLNGDWIYTPDFTLIGETKPTLDWTDNSQSSNVIGWALEIDSSSSFSSNELQTFTSWNDAGFDMTGTSFEIQNDLEIGEQWFWRVKALSDTFQLGDWSPASHFYLPNMDTTTIDADHFTMNLRHEEVMPHLSLPFFEDTYVSDDGSAIAFSQGSSYDVKVGTSNIGDNFSGLVKMDINHQIQPNNGRLISANLKMYSSPILSTQNIPVAVRPVLVPWADNASSLSSFGNNSSLWSSPGGRDIGADIGPIEDIQMSVSGWMNWNITYSAQRAISSGTNILSLMLYSTNPLPGQVVSFSSVDSFSNKPYLELIWANGSSTPSTDYPVNDYPADGQIVWDSSSHSLAADKTPTFEWSIPASSNFTPDSWKLFIDNDISNEMAGQIIFDSRDTPSNFDVANMKFYAPYDLDFSNHIQWSVQGIENGTIGYSSNKTSYWLPNEIGQEVSTTDATVELQQGAIVEELSFPSITSDTYLDENDPFTQMDGQGLYVGVSPSNVNSVSSSLIAFDFSTLPMPNTYEILSASLQLTELSNSSGMSTFYCSDMLTTWDESSTWDSPSPSTTQSWLAPGAFHSLDSELPNHRSHFDVSGEEKSCNITAIMQNAIVNGDENMSIIIQPEYDSNGAVQGQYLFADSEDVNIESRPKLILEYRTTNPWTPQPPVLTTPAMSETLWNNSSPLPQNVDSISHSFTQSNSNATDWEFCTSYDQRIYECIESVNDLQEYADWQWDQQTNTLSMNNAGEVDSMASDEWVYWKMLAIQDHRIGEYSSVSQYRIPSDLGTSDGTGNYSYELSRASIFELTGVLPQVSDASIDSNSLTNTGASNVLTLGYDASTGGNSDIILDFDLSQIPWTSALTPTSMILEMNLDSSNPSSSPLTVSAYACSSFVELTVTSANAPLCATNEITRTTLTSSSSGVVEWDLTALGQANFATGNLSFTVILDAENVSAGYDFVTSEGATNLQPKLVLEYVDNVGGIMPPSQPVLSLPLDGSILYDSSSDIISSQDTVTLSWSQSTGASSYILFLSDSTGITTFDSRFDSEIIGNTFTSSSSLNVGEVYTWWVQGINQTIPGPSSSRWTFAIGDPIHYFNNDGTYVYEFQDAAEVQEFGHVEIRDTSINDAQADSNYGSSDTLVLGTGCEGVLGSLCYGVISLDASQVPLDTAQSVHSVELTLFVDSWDLSGGAYEIEFSVHEFLDSSWNEYSLTWNTTGVNPGLTAGVDYNATPLDVKRYTSTDFELVFEIGIPGMLVDDERHWIIIANPISTGAVLD